MCYHACPHPGIRVTVTDVRYFSLRVFETCSKSPVPYRGAHGPLLIHFNDKPARFPAEAHLRAAGVLEEAGNILNKFMESGYSRNVGHYESSSFKSSANSSKAIFEVDYPKRSRGVNLFLILDRISSFI
jgi:hypothetical protein